MSAHSHTLEHAKEQVKLTPKREAVLNALLMTEKACSAYELIDFCKAKLDLSFSAMSIYRILDFLKEQQLVHKLEVANKYVACAHISCDHQHGAPQFLICESCDKVKEIHIEQSINDALKDNIAKAGYTLKSPQLELTGLCENCSE
ncbi:Fur family transcriptional regulator [Paraferrimonas sp. SM1919]|uniref:Fur family transcriptional regulator n=1 Tax=Paraferrimonas sp. SM1919 TaxID=2662263 RepID=UPI0013D3C47A|nr:Fur family transcriptional regulator [Paraferrimonas sp. SM1919]